MQQGLLAFDSGQTSGLANKLLIFPCEKRNVGSSWTKQVSTNLCSNKHELTTLQQVLETSNSHLQACFAYAGDRL